MPSFAIGFLTIEVLTSELGEYQGFRFGNVNFRITARTAVEWAAEHKAWCAGEKPGSEIQIWELLAYKRY